MPEHDVFSLIGRRALVTGGSSGVGRALAAGLARAGADVVILGRRRGPLQRTVAALSASGFKASFELCDITSENSVRELPARVGKVDILVNNAGRSDHRVWTDVQQDHWNSVVELNLRATFVVSQVFAPAMMDQRWGRIVNVSSVYANRVPEPANYPGRPPVQVPAYGASKAGLLGLTRHLAAILAPHRVTVNTISPGMFTTAATRKLLTASVREALQARIPMGRLARDADIAGVGVFLASDAAAYVTGIELVVDGGFSLW
jgi:gluconate 5-dehydrogenase